MGLGIHLTRTKGDNSGEISSQATVSVNAALGYLEICQVVAMDFGVQGEGGAERRGFEDDE
jgi:hypothetical protein